MRDANHPAAAQGMVEKELDTSNSDNPDTAKLIELRTGHKALTKRLQHKEWSRRYWKVATLKTCVRLNW